ncbi:hypothetical protein GCM10010307_78420 [Streptomyces vastus]|uniref:Uncharacterized protein n=1 Tax=Streptomyces vastus TaxID=285451 RepID=A0ABN3RTW6_9ACTN
MAYEPRAASTSQTAEISSPRESARTPQQTAPTRATVVHTRMDRGVIRGRADPEGGGLSGAGGADSGMADVGMAAPGLGAG